MNKKEALAWLDAHEQALIAARRVVQAIPDTPDDAEFGQDYYIGMGCIDGIIINVYDPELYPTSRKVLGGARTKINNYGTPGVERIFKTDLPTGYNKVSVRLYNASATCEKVQVGTRLVPAQEARPAVEEHEEPVYEWRCS